MSEPKEFDIPVLFQVAALTEDDAADALAFVIGHMIANAKNDTLPLRLDGHDPVAPITLESWFMPNHNTADGSDNPVRVIIVPLQPAYNDRQAMVREIQRLVSLPDDQPS